MNSTVSLLLACCMVFTVMVGLLLSNTVAAGSGENIVFEELSAKSGVLYPDLEKLMDRWIAEGIQTVKNDIKKYLDTNGGSFVIENDNSILTAEHKDKIEAIWTGYKARLAENATFRDLVLLRMKDSYTLPTAQSFKDIFYMTVIENLEGIVNGQPGKSGIKYGTDYSLTDSFEKIGKLLVTKKPAAWFLNVTPLGALDFILAAEDNGSGNIEIVVKAGNYSDNTRLSNAAVTASKPSQTDKIQQNNSADGVIKLPVSLGATKYNLLCEKDWGLSLAINLSAAPEKPILTDVATGIKVQGTFQEGTALIVKKLSEGGNFTLTQTLLKDLAEKFTLIDISLTKNETVVQPTGKVNVSIPVPEGYTAAKCKVFRIEATGKTDMQAKLENNYLVFEAEHFSLYAVAEMKAETPEIPSLTDAATGIKVQGTALPEGAALVVSKVLEGAASHTLAKNALGNTVEKFELFHLSLLKNEEPLQLSAKVTVFIPVPKDYDASKCRVCHIAADGTKTDMNAKLEGGALVFEADRLNLYAVAQAKPVDSTNPTNPTNPGNTTNPNDNNGSDNPATGLGSQLIWWALAMLMFMASLAVWVVTNRKINIIEQLKATNR